MADGTTTARSRRGRSAPTTPDPIEIAMEAEASGHAPRGVAERLLVDQGQLVRAQLTSERLAIGLKLLTGLAGLTLVVGLAVMVWSASQADGLVIKPFSVPPALAERGVTGETVARGLMDRISAMASTARSGETQRQVAADTGDGIKIEIPETGLSLSQVDQWLVDKLGHERRVSGEVVLRPDGALLLIARSGSDPLPDQTGQEADLSALLQKTAEALYAREQPESYANYLRNQKRWQDGVAFSRTRIASRTPTEKARGYAWLANFLQETEGDLAAAAAARRSIAIDPTASQYGAFVLSGIEGNLGHAEEAYRLRLRFLGLLQRRDAFPGLSPQAREGFITSAQSGLATATADYDLGVKATTEASRLELLGFAPGVSPQLARISYFVNQHDIARARAALAAYEPESAGRYPEAQAAANIARAMEDWPTALRWEEISLAASAARVDKGVARLNGPSTHARTLALAGRLDEAEAILAALPLDCQPCVRVRGEVAALRGDRRTADHWFSEASRMAPSLPQAPYQWGEALLDAGDPARALAQFQLANQRGPHWADPLEGWGEALVKLGKPAEAVSRFKAAEKFAPRWGRLHLKWGEALAALGKGDEARTHWRQAAALDLTRAERQELATVSARRTS
jgi:hypothetical protein